MHRRVVTRRSGRATLVCASGDTSHTVLVTGGAGFVGSHAAEALLRRGASRAQAVWRTRGLLSLINTGACARVVRASCVRRL